SSANWSRSSFPLSRGKLSATSWTQRTSKSASSRATRTIRARSTRPSSPHPHWMFQVTSLTSLRCRGVHDPRLVDDHLSLPVVERPGARILDELLDHG